MPIKPISICSKCHHRIEPLWGHEIATALEKSISGASALYKEFAPSSERATARFDLFEIKDKEICYWVSYQQQKEVTRKGTNYV